MSSPHKVLCDLTVCHQLRAIFDNDSSCSTRWCPSTIKPTWHRRDKESQQRSLQVITIFICSTRAQIRYNNNNDNDNDNDNTLGFCFVS
jgi:hypothetical protein